MANALEDLAKGVVLDTVRAADFQKSLFDLGRFMGTQIVSAVKGAAGPSGPPPKPGTFKGDILIAILPPIQAGVMESVRPYISGAKATVVATAAGLFGVGLLAGRFVLGGRRSS